MTPNEYVSGAEFGRWRQDFNEFQKRLDQRLAADHKALTDELTIIKTLQREANGKTATNIKEIAIIRREIEAIKSEDGRIEKVVESIQKDGCHQYDHHIQTLEVLEGAGVLPNTDGYTPKGFALPKLSGRQKAVAGVGVTALLIPAVSDLLQLLKAVVVWMAARSGGG